jgi:hypothetical protein
MPPSWFSSSSSSSREAFSRRFKQNHPVGNCKLLGLIPCHLTFDLDGAGVTAAGVTEVALVAHEEPAEGETYGEFKMLQVTTVKATLAPTEYSKPCVVTVCWLRCV